MQVIRSFLAAVSMYSKIPVPGFEWRETDGKYAFCFFPWIGALIGGLIFGWNCLCDRYSIGILARVALDMAIPLFITGGFHADGFMDTMDAIHSYGAREKKLEILKDSHIGAFAVIMLAAYGLVYAGAFSEIRGQALLKTACASFFLSRCLCGISAVSFPPARKEGMLYRAADRSSGNVVKVALYIQSAACIFRMYLWSQTVGLIAGAAAGLTWIYYFRRGRREFGGITGDTAGYFVLLCEGCMLAVTACVSIGMGG
ncbi:MAG: adenosylcobinamide-GDP ribazoletransferase [Clostridium sp.]|nr:adenosylcobinamide-GDP ribazoletransferase [Acetatifactor muris]MCM1527230.1 adenosylcobinamide-GDP ribazoletransferase [Bacteroides sp.]MCM1563075.1 adenosylcobinamide-GDP ribazoletransferase [Clostridium sp.]